MAPCLQGQHRPSAQVKVTWRFDASDSTAMSTPRRSSSLAASTQLRCLHDDFDAALGVPSYGGRRRVKGLRREEVAMLAGMSTDYYPRLERGNLTGVSEAVLESLARALQLDEAERAHLFDLSGAANASGRARGQGADTARRS